MRLLSFAAIGVLAACAAGPDYRRPEIPLPTGFAGELQKSGADVWWEGFGDETLTRLVGDALAANLTVEAASARVDRARALLGAQVSDFFPVVDGEVSGRAVDGAEPTAQAGGTLSFNPDLFGRTRRSVEAARAQLAAADASRDDAARIAVFLTTSTYLELRRTEARLELLEQSLDLQQQTLRIVRLRADAGLAADLDVRRAAADLARTRAQTGPLAAARRDAVLTLAVLTARMPGTEEAEIEPRPDVPLYEGGPPLGLPADLLRTRPDLRAAERQLAASTAAIGIEAADLYPRLTIGGTLAESLTGGGAVQLATGILDIPVLDFGRRRAEVRAARASAEEALANYRLTLLTAVQDVESALLAIDAAEAQRADLAAAAEASEAAFDQLQALYTEGLATLIDVLDAQRQLIGSREAFTDSTASLAQSYTQLYTALGFTASGKSS
ncbi:efflux transporter outer membrane subunit [Parvularcula maris]|uniref:Efflux transporter outer membrane subunit n=1 Tax=Parvularcula maris TaxID=2965077 RepID=A0A9X2L7S4_9PROT|nr:efflux transporter outer membrane subunit [Parvularcula maris]